ncbi:endocuticle structural glycoprotein SgAbd-9-like [Palaemon carinicauda]|uniref:endocuticle structural glycoprotein SgAbd-9-like n=1 Tax=Palaemon carinicauda TaxID=392227 RepID=UPI0035B574AF
MKCFLVILGLVVIAAIVDGRRNTIYEFETEDQSQKHRGQPGVAVKGSYSWVSPEGIEYRVKYVADELGYRIVSSNAVPVNQQGVAADGNQGSFEPLQEGYGSEKSS